MLTDILTVPGRSLSEVNWPHNTYARGLKILASCLTYETWGGLEHSEDLYEEGEVLRQKVK